MKANEASDKYNTHDWTQNYEFISLTKEHIKRLNNAINILESLNEPTDAKYLKEIKDKLLEVNEVKEVDLKKEIYDAEKRFGDIDEMGGYRILLFDDEFRDVLRYFYELGLKAEKGE